MGEAITDIEAIDRMAKSIAKVVMESGGDADAFAAHRPGELTMSPVEAIQVLFSGSKDVIRKRLVEETRTKVEDMVTEGLKKSRNKIRWEVPEV